MKQYLNIAALAERLLVKHSTLYSWAEQGMIPHLKLGRLLRFDPDEIEAWLQDHRVEGIPEPASPRCRHGTDNVDVLIAEAKRAVYTSCHGKPDQSRATRKGDTHGSV
jgi:excisionase family DNA binding protein